LADRVIEVDQGGEGDLGMTSGQRKVHVLLWLVLGPIALIGLGLAVVWRPTDPIEPGPLPGVQAVEAEQSPGGDR